jgi:hypothetical protein
VEGAYPRSAEPTAHDRMDDAAYQPSAVGNGGAEPTEGRVEMVTGLVAAAGCSGALSTILWIIAVVLVIAGIVTLIRGGVLAGIVLIIVGLLIGPGGVSIFC